MVRTSDFIAGGSEGPRLVAGLCKREGHSCRTEPLPRGV